MTVQFYAPPSLTSCMFATCAGRWFSINGQTIRELQTTPRVDESMKAVQTFNTHRLAAKIQEIASC